MALADNYEELNSIFTEIKGLDAKSDKSKIEELLEDATEILGDVEINMASIKDPAKKKEAQEKYNMYQRKVLDLMLNNMWGSEKTHARSRRRREKRYWAPKKQREIRGPICQGSRSPGRVWIS